MGSDQDLGWKWRRAVNTLKDVTLHGVFSYILVLSMHLMESPMTAEIAQFDKVPLCNQPCLFLALHSGDELEICDLRFFGRRERGP